MKKTVAVLLALAALLVCCSGFAEASAASDREVIGAGLCLANAKNRLAFLPSLNQDLVLSGC